MLQSHKIALDVCAVSTQRTRPPLLGQPNAFWHKTNKMLDKIEAVRKRIARAREQGVSCAPSVDHLTALKNGYRLLNKSYDAVCSKARTAWEQHMADTNEKRSNQITQGTGAKRDPEAGLAFRDDAGKLHLGDDLLRFVEKQVSSRASHPGVAPKCGDYLPDQVQRDYPFARSNATDGMAEFAGPRRGWLHERIADWDEFSKCLRSLKRGKAPGPDSIPNEILRSLPHTGRRAMFMLIQVMWATACTPKAMKVSKTVLLHKRDSTLDLKNYRRIGPRGYSVQSVDQAHYTRTSGLC